MIATPLPRRAFLAGSGAVLLGAAPLPLRYESLFHIERNKNANIVQYDAVLEAPDRLLAKSPVVAYWVLLAEDGRREGLNFFDRRGYGFKVVPEPSNGNGNGNGSVPSWLFYLGPAPDRTIRIMLWQQKWIAQMMLAGKNTRLTHLYVKADESAFLPSVRYVDVFGVDLVTGAKVTERLRP